MQRLLALRTGCLMAALFLGSGKRLCAADASAEGIEFFEKKIRPLLADNCFKCHGNGKKKGNLQLDSRAGLLRGGDSGPAIIAGQPEQSLLIKAIHYQDDNLRMPPRSKLADQHIADFAASSVSQSAPTWNRGPHRAMRQNALRMLIVTSPDLQVS